MQTALSLPLEDGHDESVLWGFFASWVVLFTHSDGKTVGRLVEFGIRFLELRGHDSLHAASIGFMREMREIFSNRPILVQFRICSFGVYVVMGVDLTLDVPEDEPVLLYGTVWRGSLQISGVSEGVSWVVLVLPIHQAAEVLHPQSKAAVLRL
jgi:hypothetical protein